MASRRYHRPRHAPSPCDDRRAADVTGGLPGGDRGGTSRREPVSVSRQKSEDHDDRHHHRDHRRRPRARPGAGSGGRRHGRQHARPPGERLADAARRGSTRRRSCTRRSSRAAATRTCAVARGTHVRLTDLVGDACAHVLAYRLDQPWERLNVADTVKVQWQVYLTAGHLLLSDQGRVLASIVGDTSGRQDALYGTTTRARNDERYGDGSAQGPTPAGRELFALAAAKHDLGAPRPAAEHLVLPGRADRRRRAARCSRAPREPAPRSRCAPRCRCSLLVANTAHPLDPREFTSTPLEVLAWRGEPTADDDPLWDATPEGRRAFVNTRTTSPHGGSHDHAARRRRPRPRALVRRRRARATCSRSSTSTATRPSTSSSSTPPTPRCATAPRTPSRGRTRCS